jgi:hypothetical protein
MIRIWAQRSDTADQSAACPRRRPDQNAVELLVTTSHSADLKIFLETAFQNQPPKRRAAHKRPWDLTDRLDETQGLAIIDTYRSGATTARLAATHGLRLSCLKRILRFAKAPKIHMSL